MLGEYKLQTQATHGEIRKRINKTKLKGKYCNERTKILPLLCKSK